MFRSDHRTKNGPSLDDPSKKPTGLIWPACCDVFVVAADLLDESIPAETVNSSAGASHQHDRRIEHVRNQKQNEVLITQNNF
ncbi:hypothetical protein [Cyanobium sp. Aljojuca 7D2]|uniref:hypothetical protein n=1 Tax=Cyanobium sp. Aljojuca 7D2 TaxID=2823698 RepID=UPI0020CCBF83|nr:hypothetical protein [Cyanobium sp. Aljojuca 7D2]